MGLQTFWAGVDEHGSPAVAFDHLAGAGREAALAEADRMLARADERAMVLLLPGEDDYPADLRDLPQPPVRLFAQGRRELLSRPCVAVVGTRRATTYGERVTRALASALARAGVCVVSGLARGVDGTAHRAALEVGGDTIAVLGTGTEVTYPVAHRALQAEIAERGLLLSELCPDDRADGGSFPRRNRIIAALARAVIVVEAGHGSGALITADHALELGRSVAAVPGPIDSPQSAGSNRLLRDGAFVIADAADALSLAGITTASAAAAATLGSPAEAAVWRALDKEGALDIDTLAATANLPARACLEAVSALELAGVIACAASGEIRRR